MKSVALCVIIIVTASKAGYVSDESDKEKFAIAIFTTQCARKTEISDDILRSLANKQPPHYQPVYQKFMLCLLQQMGILEEDGQFSNHTERMKWLPQDKAKVRLEKARRACGDQEGITPADTASRIFKCFIYNGV